MPLRNQEECLFVIRNCGIDEFGACKNEKLFVPFFTRFNFGQIVGMLFTYDGCNRIIEEWGGADVGHNGKESNHAIE